MLFNKMSEDSHLIWKAQYEKSEETVMYMCVEMIFYILN